MPTLTDHTKRWKTSDQTGQSASRRILDVPNSQSVNQPNHSVFSYREQGNLATGFLHLTILKSLKTSAEPKALTLFHILLPSAVFNSVTWGVLGWAEIIKALGLTNTRADCVKNKHTHIRPLIGDSRLWSTNLAIPTSYTHSNVCAMQANNFLELLPVLSSQQLLNVFK
jgi:hypothetical protein